MNAPRRPGPAGIAGRAAALAALAALAGLAAFAFAPDPWSRFAGEGAHSAARLATNAARVAMLGAQEAAVLLAAPAEAQSELEFKPVPEESARAFDRRQSSRVTRTSSSGTTTSPAPAAPAVPALPRSPGTPVPPAAPEAPSTSGDLVRMGSDITVERNEVVDGDVLTFGGNIRVEGTVRGNVSATGGDVTLASTARVEGDVLCIGGQLHEEDGAYVGGQRVTGLQGRERRIRVDGDRVRERIRDRIHDEMDYGDSRTRDLVRRLTYLLFWLLVAWVVTKFAPRRTAGALEVLRREPGMSFGLGLGMALLLVPSVVALALVVAILCITIIGIPVAIGALFAYVALIVLVSGWGYVVGAAALGERVGAARPGAPLGEATLRDAALRGVLMVQGALFVSTLLGAVPFLGWIGGLLWVLAIVAYSVLGLLGIGAIVRAKFGQGPGGQWWPPSRLFGSLDTTVPGPVGAAPPPAAPASWVPDVPAPPSPPAPPAPPPPPPPVSPPSSFMPPGGEPPPPPPPATPGT